MFGIWGDNDEDDDIDEEKHVETEGANASQHSLAGIILPSLGATAAINGSRRPELRRYIISPNNRHYK